MVKIINGVRYADGDDIRTTTAGPGVPARSWAQGVEDRLAKIEAALDITPEQGEDGDEPESEPIEPEASEAEKAEAPKRPTARKVQTK